MIPGISSFTYGWSMNHNPVNARPYMDETDLVQKAIETSIRCIQIGDNLPLHQMDPDRLSQLRDMVSTHEIRLEIGARGLTPGQLETYIGLAQYFNAPILRFIIGSKEYDPRPETVIAIINNALPQLRAYDICLGIENHDHIPSPVLARIVETVGDDQVGICLDCVNSLGAGEGLEQVPQTGVMSLPSQEPPTDLRD